MKDKSPTTFCPECRKDVICTISRADITVKLNGDQYTFTGWRAYCDECGSELFLKELNDANLAILYREYQNRHPEWHMPSGWQRK